MDRQPPRLIRSISSADIAQTQRCQEHIKKAWCKGDNTPTNYFNAVPSFTLTIPPLKEYPDKEFRDFVFNRIINFMTKEDLETNGTLNWCPGTTKFVPLYTTGDGNCLLHAASLGMWGFQDRDYTLRQAVHKALMHGKANTLYDRWKQWRQEELNMVHVRLDPHQWENEWQITLLAASDEKNHHGSMGYLDQFHIFALSNVLRRPIFLYAPPKLVSQLEGGTLQKLEFHGIYLPLLWNPANCIKNPLPIVFNNGHFSALSIIDEGKEYDDDSLLLPLMDRYGQELPVRFLLDGESGSRCKNLFLDIKEVRPPSDSYYIRRNVPCAKMVLAEQPKYMKPLLAGFINRCFDAFCEQGGGVAKESSEQAVTGPCRNKCGFSGNAKFDGYCSKCYKERAGPQEGGANSAYKGSATEMFAVLCNNNCNRPGFAKYLGMCAECFERKSQGSGQKMPRNYSSPQLPSTLPPVVSGGQSDDSRPCRTKGCDFFGKAATKYYCSQCFEKFLPKILDSAGEPSLPGEGIDAHHDWGQNPPQAGSDEAAMCSNCREFYANPEYRSLCHACFMKKTKQKDESTPPLAVRSQIQDLPIDHDDTPLDRRPRQDPPTRRYEDERQFGRDQFRQNEQERDCIICNFNVQIISRNNICQEHARKYRMIAKADLEQREMEQARRDPRTTPEPTRKEERRRISPTRAEGRRVSPTRIEGRRVSPTRMEGRRVSPTRAEGRRVSPTRMEGRRVSPTRSDLREPEPVVYSRNMWRDEARPKEKVLCRIPGCSFFAIASYDNLCENCYDHHYKKRNAQPPSTAERERERQFCRVRECNEYGRETLNGYCLKCYERSQGREEPPRPQDNSYNRQRPHSASQYTPSSQEGRGYYDRRSPVTQVRSPYDQNYDDRSRYASSDHFRPQGSQYDKPRPVDEQGYQGDRRSSHDRNYDERPRPPDDSRRYMNERRFEERPHPPDDYGRRGSEDYERFPGDRPHHPDDVPRPSPAPRIPRSKPQGMENYL